MSYKSENWKEKLEAVRNFGQQVEATEHDADAEINDQIEEELKLFFQEEEETIVLGEEGMGDKIAKLFRIKDKKAVNGIANLLNMTDVKVLQSMQKQNPKGFERMAKKLGELPAMEEVQEEKLTVEKTIEKLTEKNMLGRLAKSLRLDEERKEKMFDYFENGELKQ